MCCSVGLRGAVQRFGLFATRCCSVQIFCWSLVHYFNKLKYFYSPIAKKKTLAYLLNCSKRNFGRNEMKLYLAVVIWLETHLADSAEESAESVRVVPPRSGGPDPGSVTIKFQSELPTFNE